MFIDSHAHLTVDGVYEEIDQIISRARDQGVDKIVNICIDEKTLERGLALAERCPWIYNTASTTPHDVEAEGESFFPLVEQAARDKKLVAIGETGLDYYYEHSKREVQQRYFSRYLALARRESLPVVIHCRDAFSDFFEMIDREYRDEAGGSLPGVLHCFTGTVEEAEGVIDRGWILSLSGIVTFKRSSELREVAKRVPLEQLLIETDTPYLAPQSRRGKRNEPAYVAETAALIAELKGISVEKLAAATAENAERLFAICRV